MRQALLVALVLFLISPASALTNINQCSTLLVGGETYRLIVDINDSPDSTCMNITANNVTLDCNGYRIDGIDAVFTRGVFDSNKTGFTLRNCKVMDWYSGLELNSATNSTIRDNNFSSNTTHGVYFDVNSSNNTVQGNTFSAGGSYGFRVLGSSNIFSGNAFSGGSTGVRVDGGLNTFTRNGFYSNSTTGVSIVNGSGNEFSDNDFNNATNVTFNGGYTGSNDWNVVKTLSPNVKGGPYSGGNFWAQPNGLGFSQTCADALDGNGNLGSDGLCDTPNSLLANNVDNLPLAPPFTSLCNGNGSCEPPLEDNATCPSDCAVLFCGDGNCSGTESCSTCASDCGACPPVCGDGSCNGTDSCNNCPADCGSCPSTGTAAVPGYTGMELLLTLAVLGGYYALNRRGRQG